MTQKMSKVGDDLRLLMIRAFGEKKSIVLILLGRFFFVYRYCSVATQAFERACNKIQDFWDHIRQFNPLLTEL